MKEFRYKYLWVLSLLVLGAPSNMQGQDDDVYFVPSKSKTEQKESSRNVPSRSNVELIESDSPYDYDDWAAYRNNGTRDIDEYNRRGKMGEPTDSLSEREQNSRDFEEVGEGTYTSRIVRFHSPRVGVYVSSPYYADYVDVWIDPWYYDPWWNGFSYWGWNGWYASWGWYGHWCWHDPWFHYWRPYYGYYPHYRPLPSGARPGPHGGYVYYGHRGNGIQSNSVRGFSRYGIRKDGYTSGRPSNSYSRSLGTRPSRNFGNGLTERPSNSIGTGTSRPSRSFGNPSSSPSRSFQSMPSRSGGSRSFGGVRSRR